ncbi:IS630 family transposase [Aneurinibacillus aneurinilyticus]|uniref:IS630 family transposase n=1 Tax=Aneurinibacillus aneurinilyticus TaxID=1391 RepID=UPI002E22785D|nr:IS630 family transposase [Aneurinibacillus aneurinilyticus]MED0726245.1 IS630 family transposase [Aneurinibacillus aneurinilyticus]MED0733631.1 IS630 family transposase [Aneurinibacillus aneurinilyticus]MED0744206.1 IS630 family transposase [Aneurinibacillus aneurinilyticus]
MIYEDESRIRAYQVLHATWNERGKQRYIPTYGHHAYVGLFGMVNVHTGDFFCQPASQYKTADFHRVLMTILERYEGKRAILIMDNARSHKAEEMQPFFEANRERLFCIDLPPYSPTLNPVERMWKWLKEVVIANRFHPTQASIVQAIDDFTHYIEENLERGLSRIANAHLSNS